MGLIPPPPKAQTLIVRVIERDEVILTVQDSYLLRNDKEQWLEQLLKSVGSGDPHRLDGDVDGIACEGLKR